MKIETYVRWLFADSVETGQLEFVEQKPFEKDGKQMGGSVMYWIGQVNGEIGDYRCFPSAIKNLKEIVMALGNDDTLWIGKQFSVVPTIDKKKLVFSILK